MTALKTLAIVAALLAGGTSLALAQNGPATGGLPPVAGGAALVGIRAMDTATGGMVVLPYTATGTCTPTIRITAATGIGITKQIAAEGDCLTTNQ